MMPAYFRFYIVCLKVIHLAAFNLFSPWNFIIFMRGRYEAPEEEVEGFELAELANDNYIIVKNLEEGEVDLNASSNRHFSKKKGGFQIKEKPKFKFEGLQMIPLTSRKANDEQKCMKSMSLQKTGFEEVSSLHLPPAKEERTVLYAQRRRLQTVEETIEAAVIKTKRTQIGEDLIIRTDENQQVSKVKDTAGQATLVFKKRIPKSTHEAFREMARFASASFMGSKYNSVLRARLEKYQGKGEEKTASWGGEVSFEAGGESCNLQCVSKGASGEYNLMLSVDTNTKGHQSWFYFRLTNNTSESQHIVINICNMKRRLPMVRNGQGVYCRRRGLQWERIEDVAVENGEKGRHRLSFELQLGGSEQAELSLLPPFTYSDQLKALQAYQASPNVKVEILTYSLAGLAIPVITLTKGARSGQSSKNRNLYLVTARIHPSQTCSSFIVNALIRQLLAGENEDFLRQNVVKVVPMVNPDGVVFGNFRTNYLGSDLNRSFHSSDETLFPETVALKELGRKCKEDFGNRFVGLLDLHGHSSQPNSFIYGPQYPPASENYVECRILPKILDRVSNVFSYASSSFRLEEYKNNTARGYFCRKLKVPAYTIETSYALYCPKGEQEEEAFYPLGVGEWEELGRQIAAALKINNECISIGQEQREVKPGNGEKVNKRRTLSNSKIDHGQVFSRLAQSKSAYAKLKSDILQEIKREANEIKTSKPSEKRVESESDGEGDQQDLSLQQKSLIIKRLGEVGRGKSMFPRVVKQAILSPQLSPSVIPTFYIGNEAREGILQRMNSKFRNKRYNRPVNISQEYTEYLLRNITGVSSLKPQVVSFNPKVCKAALGKQGS